MNKSKFTLEKSNENLNKSNITLEEIQFHKKQCWRIQVKPSPRVCYFAHMGLKQKWNVFKINAN